MNRLTFFLIVFSLMAFVSCNDTEKKSESTHNKYCIIEYVDSLFNETGVSIVAADQVMRIHLNDIGAFATFDSFEKKIIVLDIDAPKYFLIHEKIHAIEDYLRDGVVSNSRDVMLAEEIVANEITNTVFLKDYKKADIVEFFNRIQDGFNESVVERYKSFYAHDAYHGDYRTVDSLVKRLREKYYVVVPEISGNKPLFFEYDL